MPTRYTEADLQRIMAKRVRSAAPARQTPVAAPGISGAQKRTGQAAEIGGCDGQAAQGAVSELEEALSMQLRAAGIPDPVREYRFDPKRRWRSDFAWPDLMLLVEVEGGHWNGGRHTRGSGFDKDAEKYNTAALLGWRVLRVTSTHIKSGEAVAWIVMATRLAKGE